MWLKLSEEIEKYVRPDTFPLGIRVLDKGESVPDKTKRPAKDFGVRISICQGITMSRRYGWTLAMGGEDLSCPIAKVAFGFEENLPFYSEGNLACGMYAENMEAAKKTEEDVPKFLDDESGIILVGPLSRISFEPETVLVYGNSAQVMRMVAAALYKRGGSITSSFSARADCADIIIRTKQTNEPQVILPCYGDRVFGQTHDHEMAFTLPFNRSQEFIDGLSGTQKGGVRYPIPTFLQYQAKFPPSYEKLNQMWNHS
ncbi:DUF169 domain-containing protein [Microaerobacter geothermalis]|uniref:DUF169 domain-containing protein n=1 Tax=Microaerobacter geothermalis TaxID=674972 RepID=UPI001F3F92C3|nr:DUF169 domain-containing protein [Microaerobacter geothermalis]MCF6093006.1 DUF169 domain-containing protein [Microaerobacter geothermalis]